ILISNVIIPAYETLSYYQAKMGSLTNQYQQLHRYSLHIDYHENQSNRMKQELTAQHELYADLRNITFLQKRFGILQRQYQLKVITQQIKRGKISSDLEKINIHQTLDGKYSNHVRYLKMILSRESTLMLEQYNLINQTTLGDDPTLTADLDLILFLPKK
ncbi:MAG: hypothetical protein HQ517_10620, partial [SAR324 cluster bacterium]|nr:hypothetical protein [SAR324 cluster bacterium]